MNLKKTIWFMVVLNILFASSSVWSKNYYLDEQQGNDSNDGLSSLTAWQTLQKLNMSWGKITAGDSILFKRNNEWEPINYSKPLIFLPSSGLHGTPENPIVLGAYGVGAKPIISTNFSNESRAFYATNVSYLIIQDIELRGDVWFYALLNKESKIHHIRLLRITIEGKAKGAATGGYLDFWSEANEVSAENWIQAPMHNIELAYSEIKNVSGSGIQIYGSGKNWVHHNKIYNVAKSGVNFAEGDSNIVEYNIISGAVGPGIKHSAHSHTSDNIVIRGNLILNTDGGGIAAYNLTNSKIHNNTIRTYNTESAILGWTTQIPSLLCGMGKTGFDNNMIVNNIFCGGPLYLWNAENVSIRYSDGQIINYAHDDLWKGNIFHSNIIYNPDSDNQIYLRYFTESDNLLKDSLSEKSMLNNWISYDSNYVSLTSEKNIIEKNVIKITCVNNSRGGFSYLSTNSILRYPLVVGQTYTLSLLAKSDSKNAQIALSGGEMKAVATENLSSDWQHYELTFTARTTSEHYICCWGLERGDSVFIDSLKLIRKHKLNYNSRKLLLATDNKIYSGFLTYNDYYIKAKEFQSVWASENNVINDYNGAPNFTNDYWRTAEDFGSFCPASNSYAIGNGLKLPDYSSDLLGNPIPNSTNPDIGALQTPCSDFSSESVNSKRTGQISPEKTAAGEVVDGSFEVITNNGTTYSVKIKVNLQSGSTILDKATIRFSYDASALFWPNAPIANTDYVFHNFSDGDYSATTVSHPSTDIISINIIRSSGTGLPISSIPIDIITINFTTINPLSTSKLQWSTREFFGVGSVIPWTNGVWPDLNTTPLPVGLKDFFVQINQTKAVLSWTVVTELNNFGFEVERKSDFNPSWERIGFVNGNGTCNSPQQYSFIDNSIILGNNYYYRLKQIDLNGAFTYSSEITLRLPNDKIVFYQNYPNPFNPVTKISYSLPMSAGVNISIYNLLGELVDVPVNQEESKGFHQINWESGKLAAGVYFIVFHVNPNDNSKSFQEVKKMLILR